MKCRIISNQTIFWIKGNEKLNNFPLQLNLILVI